MIVLKDIGAVRQWHREHPGSLGFVPTMGALHAGHASLLEQSIAENDLTVLSIYVNPTQFNNPADLETYPNTLDEDLNRARSLKVDVVFLPSWQGLYPDDYQYEIVEKAFSLELCGAHRAGHFNGVLSVVMKLLNIVRPSRAYFGEKDYQQYLLIRDMVTAFFLDVEIVACSTKREPDGLAMSSRNLNLDARGRLIAPGLYELISSDCDDQSVVEALTERGFDVDYVVSRGSRRFAAATLPGQKGEVRLIDNVSRDEVQTGNDFN